jgi:hypothetical protein
MADLDLGRTREERMELLPAPRLRLPKDRHARALKSQWTAAAFSCR